MNRPRFFALALSAAGLFHSGIQAQPVYRCGNSYSQVPCPGGSVIETSDSRDKTQKTQTDTAIQRDRQAADALEKSRLKQEASQSRASTKFAELERHPMPSNDPPADGDRLDATKKVKKSQYFTAKVATEKKKKDGPHPTAQAGSNSQPGAAK